MNKYYVNEFHDSILTRDVPYGNMAIGLFSQCRTDGRGNFCGYYASEFYLNTTLYAYYKAEGHIYKPEARISDCIVLDPPAKFREILIGSHMWTMVIEAESVEEAIEKFMGAKWRRWNVDKDS